MQEKQKTMVEKLKMAYRNVDYNYFYEHASVF